MPEFRVDRADWRNDAHLLLRIRKAVFVEEQGVPLDLEIDDKDATATHVLAVAADGTPVATGRLLENGHIGRMAVLAAWRNQGVGRALLDQMIEIAVLRRLPQAFLHAQCSAVGFYEKAGFAPAGEVFEDAGIPHQKMFLNLRL